MFNAVIQVPEKASKRIALAQQLSEAFDHYITLQLVGDEENGIKPLAAGTLGHLVLAFLNSELHDPNLSSASVNALN